ncbi:MAG: type II toxin-antitoxin system Phd/YefM family antitoxin [Thermomicrobiales bacterium]
MIKTISVRDARDQFGELLGAIDATKEPIVVERDGRPVAVVISLEDFARLRANQSTGWQAIDRLRERNLNMNPDEAFADATLAVEEVRRTS